MIRKISKYSFQIIVVVLLLLTNLSIRATNENLLLDSGNNAYSEKNYLGAIKFYSVLIEKGLEAPELYYNLGNSYFKVNNLPYAILYWEKALKLDPTDEDILFNLKVANTRITDKFDYVPVLFYKRWANHLLNLFSADAWSKLIIITVISMFLLLTGYLLSRRLWLRKLFFYSSVIVLGLTILVGILTYTRNYREANSKEAIIFTSVVTVKSSPDVQSTDIFVIHEGLKVKLGSTIGIWHEIIIPNGSKGWVREEDFKTI